jgi:hypothetical protein
VLPLVPLPDVLPVPAVPTVIVYPVPGLTV